MSFSKPDSVLINHFFVVWPLKTEKSQKLREFQTSLDTNPTDEKKHCPDLPRSHNHHPFYASMKT